MFNTFHDQYFPVITKELKMKYSLKPWVTHELNKIRDCLARKLNKGKIEADIFTRFQLKLTVLTKNC